MNLKEKILKFVVTHNDQLSQALNKTVLGEPLKIMYVGTINAVRTKSVTIDGCNVDYRLYDGEIMIFDEITEKLEIDYHI